MPLINALFIFIGSGFGGLFRYGLSNVIHLYADRNFPYGTLFVNVSGSLLMGLLFVLMIEHVNTHAPALRALLLIGFLGGYTTFSSFSIETLNLLENGNLIAAFLNVILSVFLCLVGTWIGIKIGRLI